MFKLCYDGLKSFHLLVSKEIPNSWLNSLLISQTDKDIHLIGQYNDTLYGQPDQATMFIHLSSQEKTICTKIPEFQTPYLCK